jgi:hypothetical protein
MLGGRTPNTVLLNSSKVLYSYLQEEWYHVRSRFYSRYDNTGESNSALGVTIEHLPSSTEKGNNFRS